MLTAPADATQPGFFALLEPSFGGRDAFADDGHRYSQILLSGLDAAEEFGLVWMRLRIEARHPDDGGPLALHADDAAVGPVG